MSEGFRIFKRLNIFKGNVSWFILKWGTALSVALALLGVAIAVGLFDPILLPSRGLHAEGRETEDMAPINQTRKSASLSAVRLSAAPKYLGITLGLIQPPTVTLVPNNTEPTLRDAALVPASVNLGSGLVCKDWSTILPSDGKPATWTKAGTIQHITIHSAGTESPTSPLAVANYHVGSLGWEHVGYDWMIMKDGTCNMTLPVGTMPYAQFRWNQNDVAIMLEGLVGFTEAQYSTMYKLVIYLANKYNVPSNMIKGHRDWSKIDRADVAAGRYVQNPNDHVDPCAGAAHCSWDDTQFGLPAAVDNTRNSVPADAPDDTTGATADGVATYYGSYFQGKTTHNGETYDRWSEHTTATYLVGDQPAWPYNTWLRVTSVKTGNTIDVRVNDTGNFAPPNLLDLSQGAYMRLMNINRKTAENLEKQDKKLGGGIEINVEVMGRDDGYCKYVAESGFSVCGAFKQPYFGAAAGGYDTYGFPTTSVYYEGSQAIQKFSLGYTFTWRNETGVVIGRQ